MGEVRLTKAQRLVLSQAAVQPRVSPKFRQEKMFDRLAASGLLQRTVFSPWIGFSITDLGRQALKDAPK